MIHLHDQTQEYYQGKVIKFKDKLDSIDRNINMLKEEIEKKLGIHSKEIEDIKEEIRISKIYNKQQGKDIIQLRNDYHQLVTNIREDYKKLDEKLEDNRKERRQDMENIDHKVTNGLKQIEDKVDAGFNNFKSESMYVVQERSKAKMTRRDLIMRTIIGIITAAGIIVGILATLKML